MHWSGGAPVSGQQFEYAFDDIGNRTQTKAGGNTAGTVLRTASYSPNNLNQYTSREVPGAVDVSGVAWATTAVTVNTQTTDRNLEYFHGEVPVVNTNTSVWEQMRRRCNRRAGCSGC